MKTIKDGIVDKLGKKYSPNLDELGEDIVTKSTVQIFTELVDGKWHEAKLFQDGINYKCSCGCLFYKERMDNHIKESNPTYSNPKDILEKMKQFCGIHKFRNFIYQLSDDCCEDTIMFVETYILNPPLLLKKAIEFLEQLKKGE